MTTGSMIVHRFVESAKTNGALLQGGNEQQANLSTDRRKNRSGAETWALPRVRFKAIRRPGDQSAGRGRQKRRINHSMMLSGFGSAIILSKRSNAIAVLG